jgi:sugar lactone lactonase YvrE
MHSAKIRILAPCFGLLLVSLCLSCRSPLAGSPAAVTPAPAGGLTISWSDSASGGRTILPSSYPTIATYSVTLQPESGSPRTKTGIAGSYCTFSALPPGKYAVTVQGLDSSGAVFESGSASVDTRVSAAAYVTVSLGYITSGSGTGGVELVLDLANTSYTPISVTLRLVDPSGNVTTPSLAPNGTKYSYVATAARVGTWQAVSVIKTESQSAIKMDTIVVAQGAMTIGTEAFSDSDFWNTYVPVTGLSLAPSSVEIFLGETARKVVATLAPANASNWHIAWSSSDTSVATVDISGWVTATGVGSATIKALSPDNPDAGAICSIHVTQPRLTVIASAGGAIDVPSSMTETVSHDAWNAVSAVPSANYEFVRWEVTSGQAIFDNAYVASTKVCLTNSDATIRAVFGLPIHSAAGTDTGFSGDGGPATSCKFSGSVGVAVDLSGNVYIADSGNNRIRMIDASTGVISTIAGTGSGYYYGDDIPAASAILYNPVDVAVDSKGNIYIADLWNSRARVIAAVSGTLFGRSVTQGRIYTVAGGGSSLGEGEPAVNAALSVYCVAVDGNGNLYIGDSGRHRIRMVASSNCVRYGQTMLQNRVYTIAGTGTAGFSGDGGAATSAELNYPSGIAVDPSGTLYIADANNNRIRKVNDAGLISTVAGSGIHSWSGDEGAATSAGLGLPLSVALDSSGNIFIAHMGFVREVSVDSGLITTIAGKQSNDFTPPGNAALSLFLFPCSLAVDGSGAIYFSSDVKVYRVP